MIKKKTIKIIIGIIVAIAVIVGGIFAFQFISTNMKIKKTEEKLSQINVEELQGKLIKELEKSKFNVNTSNVSTKICSWEEAGKSGDNDLPFTMAIELFYSVNKQDNPYEKGISAYITSNSKEIVAIPLFKIESDNSGKFKKIIYTEKALKEYNVTDSIKKVLKDDYGIDMFIEENAKYNTRFNKIFNSKISTIYATEKDLTKILNEIHNSNNSSYPKSYQEYSTTEFGLEINH